jgi:hypothetical protein
MPGQPTDKPVPDAAMQPGVDIHQVIFNGENEGYVLTYWHSTQNSFDGDTANTMKVNMAAAVGGETRDEHDMHLDSLPAKEFTFDDDKLGITIVARIGATGDAVYELGYSSPIGRASALNAQNYFNSFHFVTPPSSKPR